jgi:anti-sigma-K factor RskA
VPHLDPDRLVLLALSEQTADADESVHLAECSGCRAEIDALRHVAELGAETQAVRDLPPPPERVWAGIAAETGLAGPTEAVVRELPASPARTGRRSSRRSRRWLTAAVAAVAAAVLAVAGTVTAIRLLDRPPAPSVTARATLSPLPLAPASAGGDASVLSTDQLRIDVRNLPLTTGYYEVWLINPDDTSKMMAVGNLSESTDVVLPLPPGADLNQYRLVDVSAEAFDGDAAHSGKSLLRGTLTY